MKAVSECPVCGTNKSTQVEISGDYRIRRCANCGLEFTVPMKAEGSDYYQDKKFYQLKRILTDRNILPSLRAKWEFGQFLRHRPNAGGRLLDIGCGEGQFLVYAKKSSYDVYGIDIDELSVDVARNHLHLDSIYVGDLDFFYPKALEIKFDCITFFELLEHLEDPKDFLAKIAKILKPGGYIALSAPNARRITVRLNMREKYDYPPHHLTRWNLGALRYFVEQGGFEIIQHRYTPQILRYFIAGRETWWGSKNRKAERFLSALDKGKMYAAFTMRSYMGFLDAAFYPEMVLAFLLRLIGIDGMSHFLIARKR